MVVLFEGRDAAGKGGAIKTISLSPNPSHVRPPMADQTFVPEAY